MNEIIVTGSRAIEWDPDDVPTVQVARRADNLIVEVQVVNDTREAAGRRDELIRTLRAMARSAAASPDIDLSIETEGALVPLTEDMVASLTLSADQGRSDTSAVNLIVKTPIRPSDTSDTATARLEAFVEGVDGVGRSLASITGDWQLSIIDPSQYRSAILEAISADASATAAVFGADYAVQVDGLANRVTWRQSGPLDLSLFIPYELSIRPR